MIEGRTEFKYKLETRVICNGAWLYILGVWDNLIISVRKMQFSGEGSKRERKVNLGISGRMETFENAVARSKITKEDNTADLSGIG